MEKSFRPQAQFPSMVIVHYTYIQDVVWYIEMNWNVFTKPIGCWGCIENLKCGSISIGSGQDWNQGWIKDEQSASLHREVQHLQQFCWINGLVTCELVKNITEV